MIDQLSGIVDELRDKIKELEVEASCSRRRSTICRAIKGWVLVLNKSCIERDIIHINKLILKHESRFIR